MEKETTSGSFMKRKPVQGDPIDLMKLVQVFLRNWWAILICLIIGAGAMTTMESMNFVPKYTTNALIYVNVSKLSLGGTMVSVGDFSSSVALANRYTVAITSRRVLEKAIAEHKLEHSYAQLRSMVSVKAVNDTEFLSVSVTSTDPLDASQVANAVSQSLIEVMNTLVEGNNARILDTAPIPEGSSGPNYRNKALLGGMAGAAACCGLLTLLFLLDNTIKDRDDLYDNYAFPVLAVVPDHLTDKNHHSYEYSHKRKRKSSAKNNVFCGWDSMSFAGQEAYKLLRTNVEFSFPRGGEKKAAGKIVGISSSVPNEYKSTTSFNLALAMAEGSRRVLLLDCDLRKSDLRARLQLPEKKGLSDCLVENVALDDVIYPGNENSPDVLLCGTYPPNPSELLGSDDMAALAEQLKQRYDYIIMDLPPVMQVSDALVAGRFCDGILMVVREKFTVKKALEQSFRELEYAGIPMIGMVLTGDSAGSGYKKYGYKKYGYGYGYGYGYSYSHDNGKKKKK